MNPDLAEWLNLALRSFHVVAGIAWIGTSLHFMWLDSAVTAPEDPREGLDGELWMVHSGGFYRVEKLKPCPAEIPPVLHWFKWEAALTWISGILLLGVAYYATGRGVALANAGTGGLSLGLAAALSAALFVGAWIVYDFLWNSPLGRHGSAAALASFVLLLMIAFGLSRLLSGRATFIHVGAILGTLMVANVWMRILPAQREMIAASGAGRTPDFTLGARAKIRSVHNSYMTFPVVMLMLSNHYPSAYGHRLGWVALGLLVLVGAGIRHATIARRAGFWVLAPVAAAAAALVFLTAPTASHRGSAGDRVSFAAARAVVNQRCVSCHSRFPLDPTFGVAAGGVSFDTPETIKAFAERIKLRAVTSQTMPFGNKTGMTPGERDVLGRWVDQGAHLE